MAFEFGTCCLSGYFLLSVTAPVAPQTGSVGGVRARGRSCDPSHRSRHGLFLLRPASAPPFVRPRPFPWFSPGRGSRDLRWFSPSLVHRLTLVLISTWVHDTG